METTRNERRKAAQRKGQIKFTSSAFRLQLASSMVTAELSTPSNKIWFMYEILHHAKFPHSSAELEGRLWFTGSLPSSATALILMNYPPAGKIWSVMCHILSSSTCTSSARGKSHGAWKQSWLEVQKPGSMVPGDLGAFSYSALPNKTRDKVWKVFIYLKTEMGIWWDFKKLLWLL